MAYLIILIYREIADQLFIQQISMSLIRNRLPIPRLPMNQISFARLEERWDLVLDPSKLLKSTFDVLHLVSSRMVSPKRP